MNTAWPRKSPGQYEDEAIAAENRGEWSDASRLWYAAAGASLGHNRRGRYEDRAEVCSKRAQKP